MIRDISLGFVWFFAGLLGGIFSFLSIKSSLSSMQPGKEGLAMLFITAGGFLRFAVMGFLLFFAIRMQISFALLLIAGFTLARFILLKGFIQQTNKLEQKTNDK